MKKIGISFKDSEINLHDYLKNQMSPSIFIKQLLKAQMENEEKPKEHNNFDF